MAVPIIGAVAAAGARIVVGAAVRGLKGGGLFGRRSDHGLGNVFGDFQRSTNRAAAGAQIETEVRVEGLGQLRRDFRAIGDGLNRELSTELRDAAAIAARDAATLAPRRTGRLAASYKPFARGTMVGVRNPLPYAPLVEWGGTIRPRGVPIEFARRQPAGRAIERNADRLVEEIGDRIEGLAKRHGFR